jgi:tetratricopeptide (TPR) repeat protein
MKRLVAAVIVIAGLGAAIVLGSNVASRDQEYSRLIRLGDSSLIEGQTFQAIEAFSGALALKPESMLAHLKRGETYRRRGDLQAGLRDLRAASRLDPAATRPLEEIGDVNYALERDARAIEAYETYIRLDDRSARVLYKLGLARHRDGDLDGSIAALQQAVAVDDAFAEAYYLLGLCFSERAQREEAIRALERAVTLQPALAAPREELVDLYAAQGRRQEEVQELEALAALDPGRAERHIALGLGYLRGGHSDMAVMALGRAAERLPDQPGVFAALGRVWLRVAEERGDKAALRKALEALEPIASQPAASGEALMLYGQALLLSGDVERAEQVLLQATSKLPVDTDTFQHLAGAAQRLGHLDLARLALVRHDTLSEDERDRAGRAVRIGDLSMRLNDVAAAVRWYERAANAAPADAMLTQRLDDARSRLAFVASASEPSTPSGPRSSNSPTGPIGLPQP